MGIVIVDDSSTTRKIIRTYLEGAGYQEIFRADCAQAVLHLLSGMAGRGESDKLDLVLLDIVLPDIDGRTACRIIKSQEDFKDLPVIMVTSLKEMADLEKAFADGAMDYITKPINKTELLARIGSALRLKREMDARKAREKRLLEVTRQLEEAVVELKKLASQDGLTGIANRRYLDQYLERESRWARRSGQPLSLLLIDIDYFKLYNDTYGHQEGDACLKKVAAAILQSLKRPRDLVGRYGGEEFAVVLPETFEDGALLVAQHICQVLREEAIEHLASPVAPVLTISVGTSSAGPCQDQTPEKLLAAADAALYQAKGEGRNRVCAAVASQDCQA